MGARKGEGWCQEPVGPPCMVNKETAVRQRNREGRSSLEDWEAVKREADSPLSVVSWTNDPENFKSGWRLRVVASAYNPSTLGGRGRQIA